MLQSIEARNASLDNDYGTTRGSNAADSHEVALYADGVELSGNGYARAEILPADWPAADGGQKSAEATFPNPTGAWDPADSWALIDPVTGYVWDAGQLANPVEITAAGDGPTIVVAVFYNTQP